MVSLFKVKRQRILQLNRAKASIDISGAVTTGTSNTEPSKWQGEQQNLHSNRATRFNFGRFHPAQWYIFVVRQGMMWLALIRYSRFILWWRNRGASIFGRRDRDPCRDERRREGRRGQWRRNVCRFIVAIAMSLVSRYSGLDESVGKGTEEAPNWRNGHGN